MDTFKTLLLCYDATLEGRRALLRGAELAQRLGAATHLLAIAEPFESHGVDPPSQLAMCEAEGQIKDILAEGIERLKARGLAATGYLAFGRPVDHIPVFAQRLGVDLIVVGHRQHGPVARWWAPPGNAQLLDRVTCSILVSIDPDEVA